VRRGGGTSAIFDVSVGQFQYTTERGNCRKAYLSAHNSGRLNRRSCRRPPRRRGHHHRGRASRRAPGRHPATLRPALLGPTHPPPRPRDRARPRHTDHRLADERSRAHPPTRRDRPRPIHRRGHARRWRPDRRPALGGRRLPRTTLFTVRRPASRSNVQTHDSGQYECTRSPREHRRESDRDGRSAPERLGRSPDHGISGQEYEMSRNILCTFGIRRAPSPPNRAPSASNPAFHRRIPCRARRKSNVAKSGGNNYRRTLRQTDSELMIRLSATDIRLSAAMKATSGRTTRYRCAASGSRTARRTPLPAPPRDQRPLIGNSRKDGCSRSRWTVQTGVPSAG
jgi:hypothetical protein